MDQADNFDRFLSDMFPCELMRGRRIERLGGKAFADFFLDADTAELLGCENVGIFVENCGSLRRVERKLKFLDCSRGSGKWIAVMGTDTRHWVMYNLWRGLEESDTIPVKKLPPFWTANKLVFTTPEKLRLVLREVLENHWSVGGIILVDLECNIHLARGNQWVRNDRPQHIVDFRASLTRMGWAPPLLVITQGLARSVNTEPMRSAYCLEAWWYVDGSAFSFRSLSKVEHS